MKIIARSLFHEPPQRLNCAQAVLQAYQDATGDDAHPVDTLKPFGGGRAPYGICGALHAACLIAPESEADLKSRFTALAGSALCKELKKDHKLPCEQAVEIAADLLEENLAGTPEDRMRIAIPMRDGSFSEHFGGARQFLFFDANRRTRRVFRQTLLDAPEHKPGALPRWLVEQKADAVVAGAIGEPAVVMLANLGIAVHLAGEDQTNPLQLVSASVGGRLPVAIKESGRCKGHDHEHGHHCH